MSSLTRVRTCSLGWLEGSSQVQSGALPPCQVPNAESQALPPQALPRLELHKHIARPCPHIDGFPFVKRANRAAAFGMRDHASPTPQSILERLNAKARARKEAEAGQTRNGNGSGDAARQCPEDKERAESNARAGSSSHDVPRSGVGADERGSKRRRGLAEKGTSTKKARETAGAVDSPPDEAPAGNGDALGPEVDAGEAAVDVDGANGADEDREMSGEDDGGDGTVASLRGTNVTLPQGKKARKAPVLPWMRVPMSVGQGADDETLEDVAGLRQDVRKALRASGIESLFPIQASVWKHMAGGTGTRHDLCVCAPTGSGKTLAYALPLVHFLAPPCGDAPARPAPGTPRPIRALVVLPTRDLARQVSRVLEPLFKAAGLALGVAAGGESLAQEAGGLVMAGRGRVDAVVATPGRLVSHLRGTPGFSLSRLGFLVVDEADRLLRQSYQEWLPRVLAAAGRAHEDASGASLGVRAAVAAGERRVVKIVASATLTRDPSKIARLGLVTPRYVAVTGDEQRPSLPKTLREFKVVCPGAFKPHAFLALLSRLAEAPEARVMVFASSLEAAHRLSLLLAGAHERGAAPASAEFSSVIPERQRARALEQFRAGAVPVLVASDAATRGLDVEGVTAVVNYDAPVYTKTYVHRAGRTARAGRAGEVYTMLRKEDVKHFKEMLRKADNNYVRDCDVSREEMDAYKETVTAVLSRMQLGRGDAGERGAGVAAHVQSALQRAVRASTAAESGSDG